MYSWYITFADLPAVRELTRQAQERLAGLDGLDLVPAQWLHMTVQSVGFTDEVSSADVDAIVAAARHRLANVGAPRVRIGPAQVVGEGVIVTVLPRDALAKDGLTAVRDGLLAAIADTWPAAAVPESAGWMPHVSVAYSHVNGPADAYEAALAGEDTTVDVTISAVRMIILGRDEHTYTWNEHAKVPLAPPSES
jgi:2'-5' RNA ligase